MRHPRRKSALSAGPIRASQSTILLALALGPGVAAAQDATLVTDVTDGADYGYRYNGVLEHRERVDFAFEGTGTPLSLSLRVFDIDDATELEALVNGTSIGHLPLTADNGFASVELAVPAAVQTGGTDTLSFVQRVPGWKWGVTDLLLTGAGSGAGGEGGGTLKIRATPTSASLPPPSRPPEGDPAYTREFSEYRYNGPVGTPGE